MTRVFSIIYDNSSDFERKIDIQIEFQAFCLYQVLQNKMRLPCQPDWFDRYGRRVENYRLPKLDSEREALASTIGNDGLLLLDAIYEPTAPQRLRQIPAVETLRQIWVQQFYAQEPDVQVKWRTVKDMPPSTIAIHSPHDVEAHYSSKRSVDWVGYKVHMTEICDEGFLLSHI